jgi:hypothetical protein
MNSLQPGQESHCFAINIEQQHEELDKLLFYFILFPLANPAVYVELLRWLSEFIEKQEQSLFITVCKGLHYMTYTKYIQVLYIISSGIPL